MRKCKNCGYVYFDDEKILQDVDGRNICSSCGDILVFENTRRIIKQNEDYFQKMLRINYKKGNNKKGDEFLLRIPISFARELNIYRNRSVRATLLKKENSIIIEFLGE